MSKRSKAVMVNIGDKVEKKSGKPFKSMFKLNTVAGIVPHPLRPPGLAYTFEEDDSFVAVEICQLKVKGEYDRQ
jgi:hypothetical protein